MLGRTLLCVLVGLAGAVSGAEPRLVPVVAATGEDDEAALWHAARNALTSEPVWRYLDRFPKGLHTEGARRRLATLGMGPGRRFDGRWAGELRCSSGFEWLRLPLVAEIDEGTVRASRTGDAVGALALAGRIAPSGRLELEGIAGRVAGPLGDSEGHTVFLDALLAAGDLDAWGTLGMTFCVMAMTRAD